MRLVRAGARARPLLAPAYGCRRLHAATHVAKPSWPARKTSPADMRHAGRSDAKAIAPVQTDRQPTGGVAPTGPWIAPSRRRRNRAVPSPTCSPESRKQRAGWHSMNRDLICHRKSVPSASFPAFEIAVAHAAAHEVGMCWQLPPDRRGRHQIGGNEAFQHDVLMRCGLGIESR